MFTFSSLNIHWVWLAVLSAVFAGVTGVIAKAGLKKMDSTVATALRTIVVLLFCWWIAAAKGTTAQMTSLDRNTWIFLVLSGVATGASWLCYFKALQMADVNKVAPVDKLSTILTMVLAILFFHESLTRNKILSILLLTAGILCMSLPGKGEGRKGSRGWGIYAVLSAVFASLTAILGKMGMTNVDSDLGTAIRTGVVLIMSWLMVFVTRHGRDLKNITLYHTLFILLSGVTTGLSWLCYYRALQVGEASVVVPIDKLSIAVTILFAAVFLRERLSRRGLIGLILVVGGTLLLVL